MQPIERRVDWEGIKECLATLHQQSPLFLSRSLLIGGAASWFYRIQLRRANDPDFREPPQTETEQNLWLSKEIDFTGIFKGDAYELLSSFIAVDKAGTRFLEVNGIRLGFAQVGVTFDPEESFSKARLGEFGFGSDTIRFLVMDPVTLYREKQALSLKRNQPNDRVHFAMLREYVALEFVRACESSLSSDAERIAEKQKANSFLLEIKERALEIAQDKRVRTRLAPLLAHPSAKFLNQTFFNNE